MHVLHWKLSRFSSRRFFYYESFRAATATAPLTSLARDLLMVQSMAMEMGRLAATHKKVP